MAETTLKIAKLNDTNYKTWKLKSALLLVKEDLWEIVSQDPPDPVTAER